MQSYNVRTPPMNRLSGFIGEAFSLKVMCEPQSHSVHKTVSPAVGHQGTRSSYPCFLIQWWQNPAIFSLSLCFLKPHLRSNHQYGDVILWPEYERDGNPSSQAFFIAKCANKFITVQRLNSDAFDKFFFEMFRSCEIRL